MVDRTVQGRRRKRGFDAYAFLWSAAIVVFLVVITLISLARKNPVDETAITAQAKLKSEIGEHSFDPNKPPDFTVERAEIVISESDGSIKLRLFTDAIIGESEVIGVREITAEFTLETGGKLSIDARDCKYRVSGKTAEIEGYVRGEITEKHQSFTADRLAWSEDAAVITAHNVEMNDPQFSAKGKSMSIDLSTGIIEITDAVEMDL